MIIPTFITILLTSTAILATPIPQSHPPSIEEWVDYNGAAVNGVASEFASGVEHVASNVGNAFEDGYNTVHDATVVPLVNTAEAVGEQLGDIRDGAGDVAKAIGGGFSDAGREVGDGFKEAGHIVGGGISNTVQNAQEGVVGVTRDASHGIGDGLNRVGNWFKGW